MPVVGAQGCFLNVLPAGVVLTHNFAGINFAGTHWAGAASPRAPEPDRRRSLLTRPPAALGYGDYVADHHLLTPLQDIEREIRYLARANAAAQPPPPAGAAPPPLPADILLRSALFEEVAAGVDAEGSVKVACGNPVSLSLGGHLQLILTQNVRESAFCAFVSYFECSHTYLSDLNQSSRPSHRRTRYSSKPSTAPSSPAAPSGATRPRPT